MKAINLLHKEVEAIDRCLADFQQPIPRKVTDVASRQLCRLLAGCPEESKAHLAFEIYAVLRRHNINVDVVGLLTQGVGGMRIEAMPNAAH